MKVSHLPKNEISSNKTLNYISEDAQEKKRQKYKFEKYEKFQPRKKESFISDNESILKGVECQVQQLLSLFLKNIEKEEKENQGDPLFLNEIEKTKKKKDLSSYNIPIINRGLFFRKSAGVDEGIQRLNSIKSINNLNYNAIKHFKSNSFSISFNNKKNNRDININNDMFNMSSKLPFNKGYKENNTRKKNKKKFNSNNMLKHVYNGLERKNSLKKPKDLKRKSVSIAKLSAYKKNFLLGEEEKKDIKEINTTKFKNLNTQKKNKELKNSFLSNKISRNNSSSSQHISKDLIEIKDISFPTRKNSINLYKSRPKLSLEKETSIQDINKITEISKSDEEIKNTNKNKKNGSSICLNNNESILLNKASKSNKKSNFYKRSQTNFTKIFGGNVNKKELSRANTIFKSLREQLKKTIIFRPEDFNFSELNDNYEKCLTTNKKIVNKHSLKKNNPILIQGEESNSNKMSNISVIEHQNKEEKKVNNKNLKNEIRKNVLENSITDMSMSKQKLLIEKNTNKIFQVSLKDEKYRKLTHKSEVYDSLDDDEEDEIVEPNNFYINPNSIFCIIFDIVKVILSIYSVFHFPLYLAFTINFCKNLNSFSLLTIIDIIIDIYFIIDFFIGFFKAYYNFDEQLIKKRSLIIKHYIKTWCFLDLLEAIPIFSIIKIKQQNCSYIKFNKNNYGEVLNNLHYLLVYNKLFKFYKIFYTNEELSIITNKLNVPEYSMLFIEIFAVLSAFHIGSCMYIFIGRNSYKSWLYYTEENNKSFFDVYICSLYYLITSLTSVGYGDIISNSIKERIFQIFLLLIGIVAYSWTISSFSNYVKKLNEEDITFEKNIEILNDIKLNNTLLPDSLYDKIKRHLKYKQFYDKNDKNIILDCLPIGLRNILIYEMYKPIIKNFLFFKNFENIDFIVKVVLAFRPIIAIKNDILINEGDMIEDLMFDKKGELSVELPINLKDPQKNIHDYLYGDLLTIQQRPSVMKIGNSTILEKIGNFSSSNMTQTYFLDNGNITNSNLKGSTVIPGLARKTRQDMILELQEKEKERIKNTIYLRILKIRENEHFGDVLMFLEKRCPLRVRVASKKSELFFLRKVDVVNISQNYQNIWKKINKRSVYNFEQTKKLIKKIIELYCSIKGYHFDESDFEVSSSDSEEINKKTKSKKKKRNKKNKTKYKRPNSLNCIDIDKIKLSEKFNLIKKNSLNKYILKRAKSTNFTNVPKLSILKNYGEEYDPYNSSNTSERSNSQSSSSASNNRKIEKNLLKTFNRQYKYYTNKNKNSNKLQSEVSIIKEESENESTVYQRSSSKKNGFLFKNSALKNTLSNKYNHKQTLNKNNEKNNNLQIKENVEENSSENDNSDSSDENEEVRPNTIANFKNISNNSEKSDIKKNKLLSKIISSGKDANNNSSDLENSSIFLFDKNNVNNEMKSNESILIPIREENPLSNFKNKSKYLSKKNITNIVNKNILTKTKNKKKFQELLKSNISSSIIENKEGNENKESKNESSIKEIEKSVSTLKKYNNFNLLKIENSIINFEIKSSYENINNICNNKYSRNIDLQNKLKTFLFEEINNSISENRTIKNTSIINTKTKKRRANSVLKSNECRINKLMTYNRTTSLPNKKENQYKTNIGFDYVPLHNTLTASRKNPKKILTSNKRELIDNGGVIGNKQTINPVSFTNKKKKENLLSMINLNIQTTNQKLNNPNEFYSMYFQSLLKNEKMLKNKVQNRNSVSFFRTSIYKGAKVKSNKVIKKIK